MKITNYLLLLGVFVTLSCEKIDSDDLKSDVPFYQDYKVTYKKEENTLVAEATFRANDFSGVRLELKQPSQILCNDKTTQWIRIDNYFYKWNFKGKVDANFVLTNNKGETFNNKILFSEINDFTIPDKLVIKLDGTTNFVWEGKSLQKNESISARIIQGDEVNFDFSAVKEGATSINFPKASLSSFKQGEALLVVFRTLTVNGVKEEDSNAGGKRIMTLVTEKKITLQ